MASDEAIQATNDDATLSKRFAVQVGYWSDPYIGQFANRGTAAAPRRAPEINRGYFARTRAIKILLDQFLKVTNCECQIVNLGAGFDTTYWRLSDEGKKPKNFIEVDFKAVTSKKCHFIKNRKQLLEKISSEDGEICFSNYDLHADDYHVVGADMRNLSEFESKLNECHIDWKRPTLFMSECVLVYLEFDKSQALLKYLADKCETAFFISYEQVNMGDRFGQVMVENLRTRNCDLNGIDACISLDTQMKRFTENGWTGAEAVDMMKAYKCLPHDEVKRMEKLEFMDEQELLVQLLQHYCICWAYREHVEIGLAEINIHSWNQT
ncbi:leucine carboxyl methyltransferase 1-like [Tubulanus polymorphus]|uniref:leucine carboxyl methyltransferase 1-like n=1 Tax=Tubulanus polymorphus TaxID=672921 RepID=UPI003DA33CC5